MGKGFKLTINKDLLEEACSDVMDYVEENIDMVVTRRDFRDAVNRIIYEESYEYVPYRTGKLSGSSDGIIGIDSYVSITSRGIRYKMPYAGYQYYGEYKHPLDGPHPLATNNWIEVAYDDKSDVIMSRIEEVLEANLKAKFRS